MSPMAEESSIPSKVFTHGYVHGHIHKHRNHTHIHGHIHNHDHRQAQIGSQQHLSQPIEHRKQPSTFPLVPVNAQAIETPLQAVVAHDASSAGLFSDAASTCLALDSLPECSEMYCYELDDCFFEHCGNNEQFEIEAPIAQTIAPEVGATMNHSSSSTTSHSPVPPLSTGATFAGTMLDTSPALEHDCCHECQGLSLEPCEDPSCPIDTQVDCNTASTIHKDSLCQEQENKKQLFESLIKNLDFETSLELDGTLSGSPPVGEAPPSKRRKLTFNAGNSNRHIDIHFPHICHQHSVANLHQSCFHTTIPNVAGSSNTYDDGSHSNLASNNADFDFVIQFNNFDQKGVHNSQQRLVDIPSETSQLHPEKTYSCQWDNCFRSLSDDTFLDHLLGQHIEQEYRTGQKVNVKTENMSMPENSPFTGHASIPSDGVSELKNGEPSKLYQCEWNNCNFADAELNGLLNHILQHKENDSSLQSNQKPQIKTEIPDTISKSWIDLTPSLTHLSPDTSMTSNSLSYQQLQPASSVPFGHLNQLQPLLQQQASEQINITDFKLFPKDNKQYCSKKPIDPTFTCKWQIGIDAETGKPIECNRSHDSAGSLQEHLISEHIGGGKSEYHCGWVGCERHQGKSFAQRQKLLRHIYIHTGYKPCVCPVCGVSFAVEVLLTQHMRIHSGEKPYECQVCGKRFATSSSLSIHNRVHSDNRPLVCPYPGCGKRFRESTNLTKHRRTHERLVTCDICQQSFTKKTQLKKHMTECHGGGTQPQPIMALETPSLTT